jgi:hypothetical protein
LAQGYRDWIQTDTTKPVAVETTKEEELLSEGEMIIKKHKKDTKKPDLSGMPVDERANYYLGL